MLRSMSETKPSGKRRRFTAEHEAEVVRLCEQPGEAAYAGSIDLGHGHSSVSWWGWRAQVDAGGGGAGSAAHGRARSVGSATT